MTDLTGWRKIGHKVLYLTADDREHPVVHDGRGVMTFYQASGDGVKESWRPPADDLRLVWNPEWQQWDLYVRDDEPLMSWERS